MSQNSKITLKLQDSVIKHIKFRFLLMLLSRDLRATKPSVVVRFLAVARHKHASQSRLNCVKIDHLTAKRGLNMAAGVTRLLVTWMESA